MARQTQLNIRVLLVLLLPVFLHSHTNACIGGRNRQPKPISKVGISRGKSDRYVQPNLEGILLSNGITEYERRERWTDDLNRLESQFFYELDGRLEKSRAYSQHLRDAMVKAEEFLRNWRRSHNFYYTLYRTGLDSLSSTQLATIIAYTLEYPNLYSDFNRQTRELVTQYDWDRFEYQVLLALLNKLITAYGYHPVPLTVYRGVSTQLSALSGSIMMFRQITSTSSNREVVENYLSLATGGAGYGTNYGSTSYGYGTSSYHAGYGYDYDSETRGTLFVIRIRTGLGISSVSEYQDEDEFLLRSHEYFRVVDVIERRRYREIHLEGIDDNTSYGDKYKTSKKKYQKRRKY